MHEVAVGLLQCLEVLGCMVELLDASVIRVNCSLRHGVDVVGVVEAVMSNIVTNSCSDKRDQVELTEFKNGCKIAVCEESVAHLSNIDSMQVVVVLHCPAVLHVDPV